MEAEGKVLSLNGKTAVVEIVRKSACSGNCADCTTCVAQTIKIKALAEVEVLVGDSVTVESKRVPVLLGMFALFILPVLLPVCCYFIFAGTFLAVPSVILAILCSIAFSVLLSKNKKFIESTKPVIISNNSRKR